MPRVSRHNFRGYSVLSSVRSELDSNPFAGYDSCPQKTYAGHIRLDRLRGLRTIPIGSLTAPHPYRHGAHIKAFRRAHRNCDFPPWAQASFLSPHHTAAQGRHAGTQGGCQKHVPSWRTASIIDHFCQISRRRRWRTHPKEDQSLGLSR